jgi:hypothetical protein
MSLVAVNIPPPSEVQTSSEFLAPQFGTSFPLDLFDATFQAYYDTQANIEARSGDPVGTIYMASDVVRLYVYDGANWQYYTGT